MSHIVAGETIIDYVTHTDADANLVSGATLTVLAAEDPNGDSFTPTITEIGGGVYKIEIATHRSLPGRWYLLVGDLALDPIRYYDGSWDVDAIPTEATSDSTVGTSRLILRRSVGRLLGDLIMLEATGDGTTTTLVDAMNLHQQDGSLVGRQLHFATCGNTANNGETRRVSTNVKSTTTITFAPALPAATLEGDEVEMWNERGSSVTVDEVHDAINRAIRAAAGTTAIPTSQQVTGSFDQLDPIVTIPDAWEYFSRAQWKDADDRWRDIPNADLRLDHANREVEIRNRSRVLAHGRAVRLHGHAAPGVLAEDTDATQIDAEWICYYAANQLLVASAHRQSDSQAALSKAGWFGDQADRLRPKTRVRPTGRFTRLR